MSIFRTFVVGALAFALTAAMLLAQSALFTSIG
jgi:hypothetical protein